MMKILLGLKNPISVCAFQSVSVQSYNYELCVSALIALAKLEIVTHYEQIWVNDFKIKPCTGPNVLKQLGVKKKQRELK